VKVDGHPDEALAALAFRQFGVVGRPQLVAAGLTAKQIEVRLRRGTLIRLHRGVYAVGHRRLGRDGILLAAVFAAGRGAVVSHRDAAGLHGIRPARHRTIDVTVDRARQAIEGVRLHRAALPPDEVTAIRGVPVTTLARTVVDLAGVLAPDHLRRALHEAERLHRVDVREIERALARTRTRNGAGHAAMRAALEDVRAHGVEIVRSDLELAFAGLARRFGLPRPRTNVWVHGREVDAWWPAQRVAVEADGWESHGTRRAFQRDREKGNHLALHGVTLLRFTHRDVAERPERVAREVAEALARVTGPATLVRQPDSHLTNGTN
jgi:very-short-patch-repair endonuclease